MTITRPWHPATGEEGVLPRRGYVCPWAYVIQMDEDARVAEGPFVWGVYSQASTRPMVTGHERSLAAAREAARAAAVDL